MPYKDEINNMTFSYSRIHTYEQCPYAFYLQYIEEEPNKISNYYAENGKAVHRTLEKIFKKEITLENCIKHYLLEYDKICEKTKEKTMKDTLNSCIEYFETLDLKDLDNYEILGIEQEISTYIGRIKVIGYIDLLLKDKSNGDIIVLDHKSSKYMLKKNGVDVLKGKEKDFLGYKHQLYLYSKWVIEKYGREPKKLVWNHFKNKKVCIIDFNKTEYDETILWFKDLITKLRKEEDFDPNMEFVRCNTLCNYRHICDYKRCEE